MYIRCLLLTLIMIVIIITFVKFCIAPLGHKFRGAGGGKSVVCANRVLK